MLYYILGCGLRGFVFLLLIILCQAAFAQTDEDGFRGSIPEELLRPRRGEALRYPIDTVIGSLGMGSASDDAYSYAQDLAAALLSLQNEHPNLASVNEALRLDYFMALTVITARSYRLGGGRDEPDGAVSFMIRFIGRDSAITGELFIRFIRERWVFEDLMLESAKSREEEQREARQRFDFSPYERFF